LLEKILSTKSTIKVKKIDVTKHPEKAEEHRIVAVPTIICGDFKVCGACDPTELENLFSEMLVNNHQTSLAEQSEGA